MIYGSGEKGGANGWGMERPVRGKLIAIFRYWGYSMGKEGGIKGMVVGMCNGRLDMCPTNP